MGCELGRNVVRASGQAAGGESTVGHWLGLLGEKPSSQSQLVASALSWGADCRLLVGGRNGLFCVGQRARPIWEG